MKLIAPRSISGGIMDLIDKAREKVIIISPYYKISKWYKLENCFSSLRERNIQAEFYVREGEIDSILEIKSLGYPIYEIPNLHAKLYLNETSAIVSSMNLHQGSDTSSLDLAYQTETIEEYNELNEFFETYIQAKVESHRSETLTYNLVDELRSLLTREFGMVGIKIFDEYVVINAKNIYEAGIKIGSTNNLILTGILSNKEYEFLINDPSCLFINRIKLKPILGKKGTYDLIQGIVYNIKGTNIHTLSAFELKDVVNFIFDFIYNVEEFKSLVRSSPEVRKIWGK